MARLIWGLGHQKQITVYHVTEPLASPGNDEADTLAKVRWLEMVPASLSGREAAQWLRHHLLYAGQKTMWSTIKTLLHWQRHKKLMRPVLSARESIPEGLWELLEK